MDEKERRELDLFKEEILGELHGEPNLPLLLVHGILSLVERDELKGLEKKALLCRALAEIPQADISDVGVDEWIDIIFEVVRAGLMDPLGSPRRRPSVRGGSGQRCCGLLRRWWNGGELPPRHIVFHPIELTELPSNTSSEPSASSTRERRHTADP